jgi:hypothetical protein
LSDDPIQTERIKQLARELRVERALVQELARQKEEREGAMTLLLAMATPKTPQDIAVCKRATDLLENRSFSADKWRKSYK